jgi:hypothetical protein
VAYVMTFSNTRLSDCFYEAGFWLNEHGQRGVNAMALTTELELAEDGSPLPEVHHLSVIYNDGNEPAETTDLAAYREEHGRQL